MLSARGSATGADDLLRLLDQAPPGAACLLHCGACPASILAATLPGRHVVCVDEDSDGCRRVLDGVRAYDGGTHAQVRLGPPDVVVGPHERFDLIVDVAGPGAWGDHVDVVVAAGPTLTMAEHHLAERGALLLQVPRGRGAAVLREYVDARGVLRVVETHESETGATVALRLEQRLN